MTAVLAEKPAARLSAQRGPATLPVPDPTVSVRTRVTADGRTRVVASAADAGRPAYRVDASTTARDSLSGAVVARVVGVVACLVAASLAVTHHGSMQLLAGVGIALVAAVASVLSRRVGLSLVLGWIATVMSLATVRADHWLVWVPALVAGAAFACAFVRDVARVVGRVPSDC